MKINTQWLLLMIFLPKWKLTLLSLMMPFIILLFYYLFIYTNYQQEITQQHIEIAQRLKRINHHKSTLGTMPSINSLIIQQIDYDIPFNNLPVSEQLQRLLMTYSFIPEVWENMPNSLYKLTFTLSYPQFLTLLEYLNQTSLALISLNIVPIETRLISVQMSLSELSDSSVIQDEIS
ncbi:hypothetical protein BHE86_08595 [Shigella sp. FC1655]|uniref:hypothetical protein n=1 Tax=Proteus vulgaris TaxID=585 RepID=UPI000847FBB5|nr:hypothetical protein [Proteus vulgaris]ODQ03792.1 hypothetical protein BGK50_07105 [Shigella sp. FC130]OEI91477.1 hypothetical protein BHE86_08595 [Shigella sp. FC1655]WPF04222.1 hypothetical protein SB028_19045 [Proteus vulgaris]